MTKNIIGILLILLGIAIGLYTGIWWAFIGGILQIINASKNLDCNSLQIAIGILKIMFASAIGWITGVICILPGIKLLN